MHVGLEMEELYKEGFLMKRQRGLRASDAQRKNLKFQKRFFRLTKDSLDYYEKKASLTMPYFCQFIIYICYLCIHHEIASYLKVK